VEKIVNGIFEQLKSFFDALDRQQRLTLVFATVLSIAAVVGVLFWASAESYKTVYTSNDATRVQSAATALDNASIPYSITDDGFQIKVTTEYVGQARVVTAGVSSISGMEVLGNMKLGISPQQERWVYLNALQGELVKTINSLEEVAASRVHLVEAERSAFLKRGEESTASVTVQLHPGKELSSLQIKGITSLVAGAVRGLKSKQVVLVNDAGELLNGTAESNDSMGSANSILEARLNHENRYKKTITEQLTRILGSTSAFSIGVTVDVVESSTETQTHNFKPEEQVTISETIKESSSKDEQPVGIPGSESNLSEQTPEAEEASSDEKFQSATNYDYSSVTEHAKAEPGSIKRVSVSVFLNATALNKIVESKSGELTPDTIRDRIKTALEATIGINKERGDKLVVDYEIPFMELSTEGNLVTETVDWEAYIKYALMLLVILLVFLFIIRPIISTYNQTIVKSQQPELTAEQMEALQDADGSNMALARRLRRMVDSFDTIDAKELNSLVEQHEQPSAEVLRRWLRAS
jgi:flagellar M-ring protein FliF